MREYLLVLLVTAAVTYMLIPLVRRGGGGGRARHAPRVPRHPPRAAPAARRAGHVRRAGRRADRGQPADLPAGPVPGRRVEDRDRAAAGRGGLGAGGVHLSP